MRGKSCPEILSVFCSALSAFSYFIAVYTGGSLFENQLDIPSCMKSIFSYDQEAVIACIQTDFVHSATVSVMSPPLHRFLKCVGESRKVCGRPSGHFEDFAESVPSLQCKKFCLYFAGYVATLVCQGMCSDVAA
jgi:hypothetical protein